MSSSPIKTQPISDPEKIDAYYRALVDRNQQFVGTFFVGVKTTSVLCIPTCRARKPKKINTEYFSTLKDGLDHGYRPCKICRPTENAAETPPEIETAIDLVRSNPKEKITDWKLKEAGIAPEKVRRWFKKTYGITFHTFQRMYRVNHAFEELKHGKGTTATAFDSGYESLSGFGYTYKKLLGKSPSQSTVGQLILISRTTTPLGPMFICATDHGICMLEFVDRRMLETEFKDLQRLLKAPILIGENDHIKQLKHELKEYYAGARQSFEVALHTPGTDFQNQVWRELVTIPYGSTRSYAEQAERIGNPKAVRAVGTANGMNRISIVVPCHRVIGSNGDLTGYGGGLERKRWLLEHEARHT